MQHLNSGSFPFVPHLSGGIIFAPPDARVIFLLNDLLCNGKCPVTGGGGGGHNVRGGGGGGGTNGKHNRLTSGELLSNDRRAVGFVTASHGLVTSGRYIFIPFLKVPFLSQMGQTKNLPSEKLHKREQDSYICYKLTLIS